ncbi:Protein ABHD17C [Porphyridium purpureum]|uniref:Protein ABHD17C n=1 Tax=Porphyridium purpureum TaxID=35688 RepID=A0A5J4YWW1_PORPP|nr:Protein ABHD17C [Porphyridium purpureum]|eukprot:POR6895..scf209_3
MGGAVSSIVFQPPKPAGYRMNAESGTLEWKEPLRFYESKKLHGLRVELLPLQHAAGFSASATDELSPGNKEFCVAAVHLKHPRSQCTIIYSHGTSEDLAVASQFAADFCNEFEADVVAYDYLGYGLSSGSPDEKGVYASIMTVYMHLVDKLQINPEKILLLGRSLGSGPSTYLASQKPAMGLVLLCPLSSVTRVIKPSLTVTPSFDMFANIDRIGKVACPILIIHGMCDDVIPWQCADTLYDASLSHFPPRSSDLMLVKNADHNNLLEIERDAILKRINTFILCCIDQCAVERSRSVASNRLSRKNTTVRTKSARAATKGFVFKHDFEEPSGERHERSTDSSSGRAEAGEDSAVRALQMALASSNVDSTCASQGSSSAGLSRVESHFDSWDDLLQSDDSRSLSQLMDRKIV